MYRMKYGAYLYHHPTGFAVDGAANAEGFFTYEDNGMHNSNG